MDRYARMGVPHYLIYNPMGFRGERILKGYQRRGVGYVELLSAYSLLN